MRTHTQRYGAHTHVFTQAHTYVFYFLTLTGFLLVVCGAYVYDTYTDLLFTTQTCY